MQTLEGVSKTLEKAAYFEVSSEQTRNKPLSPLYSFIRAVCLNLSNAILQFPIMFELQQRALRQPTLLRAEVEQELDDLRKSNSGKYRVLDYGCGSGTYSGLCEPDRYLGIDCNESMLIRAARNNPDHSFLRASSLEEISHNLDDVVHVLMIGVVHHLTEEDFVNILAEIPADRTVKLLTIDTLKCSSGLGWLVQLFERGDFLRSESDHLHLLDRVATKTSYKKVPYGSFFELAVFRGEIRKGFKV
ncbi:MAG: class I SAM-dependent methyltransferase [Candidatus Melainabacteria bacterium]|nr:class I SAM-dependent methyltransferase [Candidatus Melainabacteria bacterium]